MASKKTTKTAAKKKETIDFAAVVAMALELPGVEESTSYGTPALKVRGKLIARLKEDGETLVVKVESLEARDVLMTARPKVFFVTDHYLAYPYMLVRLLLVKRSEILELIEEAWSFTASRTLVECLKLARAADAKDARAKKPKKTAKTAKTAKKKTVKKAARTKR